MKQGKLEPPWGTPSVQQCRGCSVRWGIFLVDWRAFRTFVGYTTSSVENIQYFGDTISNVDGVQHCGGTSSLLWPYVTLS